MIYHWMCDKKICILPKTMMGLEHNKRCMALIWAPRGPYVVCDKDGNKYGVRTHRCKSKRQLNPKTNEYEDYCWLHMHKTPVDALGKLMRVGEYY